MNKAKKNKIIILCIGMCVMSFGVYLLLNSISTNIMFFLTPTELQSKQEDDSKAVRLGGLVKKGSIKTARDNSGLVEFILTDETNEVKVKYMGILPSLFKEGQGIVAKGYLTRKPTDTFIAVFSAKELLAKHDENYKPPTSNTKSNI